MSGLPSLLLIHAILVGAPPAPGSTREGRAALDRQVALLRGELGISLMPASAVTSEWVASVREAFELLPAGLRRFPGGELELELHAEPSAFGMGEPRAGRPDWTGGLRRFHAYAYHEPDEPRALFRLRGLERAQRLRLWRARAVIHAVIRRWDEALAWSRRDGWKRIAGWRFPGEGLLVLWQQPGNTYEWAYSRRRGMESAALDLATFAEEALAPVEAFAPGALPVDDSVSCQEFTKLRFLAARLREIDPALPPSLQQARCPAFERWADLASLEGFEVLFSAPSGARPESLFGHLFLRIVRRPGAGARIADEGVEIAAVVGPAEPPFDFVLKGLTGGFQTAFSVVPMSAVLRESTQQDSRDLRRYQLNLVGDERRRMMERIWELERRGFFRYYFLSENCASMLIFLLNGVLTDGRRIALPFGPFVFPTSALDRISDQEAASAEGRLGPAPLLERIAKDLPSNRAAALEAEARRDALVEALAAHGDAALRGEWRALGVALGSRSAPARSAAYQRLPDLVGRTLGAVEPDARRYVSAEVAQLLGALRALERYLADRAEGSAERVLRGARVVPAGLTLPTTAEVLAERQRVFQREDAALRTEVKTQEALQYAELLESMPLRPLSAPERAQVDEAAREREVFVAFNRLAADVAEQYLSEQDPVAPPEVVAGPWPLRRSGHARLAVGAGASRDRAGAVRPTLALRGALLSELLGEQRQNGLGARTELRLLDLAMQWGLDAGTPRLEAAKLTVVRVRTLGQEPRIVGPFTGGELGWDAGLEISADRALDYEGVAYAGGLWALSGTKRLDSYAVVTAGISAAAAAGSRRELRVGPRLGGEVRRAWGGPLGPALVAEASYMPGVVAAGPDPGSVRHSARAALALELLPRVAGAARGVVTLGTELRLDWGLGAPPPWTALGSLMFEWQ